MPLSDRRTADRRPALVLERTVARPRAAVLILHGDCTGKRFAVRRALPRGTMIRPFVHAVLKATEGHEVMVGRVHVGDQGWNGSRAGAARDARRAIDELALLTGSVPVVLVGYSMGGRAALSAARPELVSGVVGLAAWCPPDEPVRQLAGCRVVLFHGDRDRATDPRGSVDMAVRARDAGADACAVLLRGGDHLMMRRGGTWRALTAASITALLGMNPFPEVVRDALRSSEEPVRHV